jgi:hypothetical protein
LLRPNDLHTSKQSRATLIRQSTGGNRDPLFALPSEFEVGDERVVLALRGHTSIADYVAACLRHEDGDHEDYNHGIDI